MNTELMFSSKSDMWETPLKLFLPLNDDLHFKTDVCATPENAKCNNYYTPDVDGLKQEWHGMCWMNPPYGRQIGKWVEKAYTQTYLYSDCQVMCLLPARTDTKWFHNWCLNETIAFIKSRLYFGDGTGRAPFPSMLVLFGTSYQKPKSFNVGDGWVKP
jgi:phage N-6-adenine-methyltransferase